MKHWKSNIDSFICPVCDLEVSNPRNYPDCKCPRCGFQDIKDARLYALLARAGVKELPDRDPMTFFASTGRAQGKTLAEIKSLFKLVNQLADALETALDEKDALEADFKLYRERNIKQSSGVYACDLCEHGGDLYARIEDAECPAGCDGMNRWKWRGAQKKSKEE